MGNGYVETDKTQSGRCYIRRFCTSDQSENNFIYYVLGKKERHTLADYVTGVEETSTNKIVLYSSAQTGKTTELKQLCWELQQSGLYLPVSFEVRTNTKLKRDDLPESQYVDGREVVLVIDALDEVNGQKYEDLLEEIGGYAYEHPENEKWCSRAVVTSAGNANWSYLQNCFWKS